MVLAPKVVAKLRARDSGIPVVVGGIIPKKDVDKLPAAGVAAVLTPGAKPEHVVAVIHRVIEQHIV